MPAIEGAYTIEVDWDNDGDYGDSYENLSSPTNYVLGVPSIKQGRESLSSYDDVGAAEFILKDPDGVFAPHNTASPIYGGIKTGRKAKITLTYTSASILFTGKISELNYEVGNKASESRLYVRLEGPLAELTGKAPQMAVLSNGNTGQAFRNVLYAIGLNSIAVWEAGLTTMQNWWPDCDLLASQVVRELQDMEFGRVRESTEYEIVFDNRYHIFNPPHDSAQATYGTGGISMQNVRVIDSRPSIFNEVIFPVRPMYTSPSIAMLRISDLNIERGGAPPLVPAEDSIDLYTKVMLDSEYRAISEWGAPTFEANSEADGSGNDTSAWVSVAVSGWAMKAKYVITNTHPSGIYLTKFVANAKPIYYGDRSEAFSDDSTSKGIYGHKRWHNWGHTGRWRRLHTGWTEAKMHADYLITLLAAPRIQLQFDVLANKDADHMAEARDRRIGDRIHIEMASPLFVDGDFIIDNIRHGIISKREHWMTVTCTLAHSDQLAATGDSYTPFDQGERRKVEVVASLPNAGDEGRIVLLLTDHKIYRDNGSSWDVGGDLTDFDGDLDDIDEGTTNKHLTSTKDTKLGGIEENATVGSNWDANLTNIPSDVGTEWSDLGTITAGSITGVTITGGTIRTSSGSTRVEMTSAGIIGYASGVAISKWDATNATLNFKKLYSLDYNCQIDLSEDGKIFIDTDYSAGYSLKISDSVDGVLLTAVPYNHGSGSATFTISTAGIDNDIKISATGDFLLQADLCTIDTYVRTLSHINMGYLGATAQLQFNGTQVLSFSGGDLQCAVDLDVTGYVNPTMGFMINGTTIATLSGGDLQCAIDLDVIGIVDATIGFNINGTTIFTLDTELQVAPKVDFNDRITCFEDIYIDCETNGIQYIRFYKDAAWHAAISYWDGQLKLTEETYCSDDIKIASGKGFYVGANQVVSTQGAAVADATTEVDVIIQLNILLARLRTHGLIAT